MLQHLGRYQQMRMHYVTRMKKSQSMVETATSQSAQGSSQVVGDFGFCCNGGLGDGMGKGNGKGRGLGKQQRQKEGEELNKHFSSLSDPSSQSNPQSMDSCEDPESPCSCNPKPSIQASESSPKKSHLPASTTTILNKPPPKLSSAPSTIPEGPMFEQEKKSYRKQQTKRMNFIPYRKCQSSLEERIVGVINKIVGGKECEKEVRSLVEKVKKVHVRELLNKFVISGICTIEKLVRKCQQVHFNPDLKESLQFTILVVKDRVVEELNNVGLLNLEQNRQQLENISIYKKIMVKKAYKVLKKIRKDTSTKNIRCQAIAVIEQFFQSSTQNINTFIQCVTHN